MCTTPHRPEQQEHGSSRSKSQHYRAGAARDPAIWLPDCSLPAPSLAYFSLLSSPLLLL